MGLTNVWVQTAADGLVRADQVIGIDAHQSPALSGKPVRWLLDVVLPTSIGSGNREGWGVGAVHRTLVQSGEDPGDAPAALAQLLAQLGLVNAAGVITTSRHDRPHRDDDLATGSGRVRFRFEPFPSPPPGHHTGAEYL